MTLYPDLHRRCLGIGETACTLGALVAAAEALDAAGEPPLTGTEAARLLLRLDRLAYRLEALADRLSDRMPLSFAREAASEPAGPAQAWPAGGP